MRKCLGKLKNWYDGFHYGNSNTILDLDSRIKKRAGKRGQSVYRLLCVSSLIAIDYLTTKNPVDHYGIYAISVSLALASPFMPKDDINLSEMYKYYETSFTKRIENNRLFKKLSDF